MTDCLLVDGYNILHAWPHLAKLMDKDLEHARTKLIEQLSNYGALTGTKIIIVFDAHLVKGGQGSSEETGGVEIIYTPEGVTADMAIEKLAARLAAGRRVTVATSDWTQQRMVFAKGAVRMPARELLAEVLSAKEGSEAYKGTAAERGIREHLSEEIKGILEKIRRSK
ncbi:MAG: NYN domain-containing protein [Bacillota bacterium]